MPMHVIYNDKRDGFRYETHGRDRESFEPCKFSWLECDACSADSSGTSHPGRTMSWVHSTGRRRARKARKIMGRGYRDLPPRR